MTPAIADNIAELERHIGNMNFHIALRREERKDGIPDSDGYVAYLEATCTSVGATMLLFCEMVKSLATISAERADVTDPAN